MYFITLLLSISINILLLNSWPNEFEKLMANPLVKELINKYEKKEIKTKTNLHLQLKEAGILVGFRTLERYLSQIKKCKTAQADLEEDMQSIDYRKCYSKFDKKLMYLIGTENEYRKFAKTNEHDSTIYVECLNCRALYESCDEIATRTVASAIIREGILDKSHRIIHNPNCNGKGLENFVSEQMDRAQRREIGQCSSDMKSLWREGASNAREQDVDMDLEIDDPTGFSYNYSSWSTVRSSYNRRRQQHHGQESTDKFFVPDRLQLSKHGAIKLVLGKPLKSHDMWLQFRNREEGVLLFMTHTQIRAASFCKIMVSDATFHLAPSQFRQLWTVHGLMELENGAEWTPLLFAVMEKRTQSAYEILLEQLNEKWGDNVITAINRIHTDYEMAEINALQKFFGIDRTFGCVVHFIRATVRHIQTNRPTLFKEFIRKGEVWKWIRRCLALPFLRKAEIKKMWPILKTFKNDFAGELREEMNGFVVYFTNQWISKIDRGNLFSFNKLSRTRSTNPVESWHSVIKRDAASVRHASLANVLNYFQIIFAESDERVVKILNDKIKPKPREKIYERVDENIQNLLTEYEEMIDQNQISEDEFGQTTQTYLNRLSYLLLQMEGENPSTRKDIKIRERKRKLSSEVRDKQKKSKDHGDMLVDMITKDASSSRNEQNKDHADMLLDSLRGVSSSRNEQNKDHADMLLDSLRGVSSNSEASLSRYASSSQEDSSTREMSREVSTSRESEVEHVASLARTPINFLFNPPDSDFQNHFCETWEYTCDSSNNVMVERFEFTSTDYGPGTPIRIRSDGS